MSQDKTALLPVPFHGATLYLVEHNGQPYAPLRPIVEGMGLDWASQFIKLKDNRDRWGVVEITTPSKGGQQKTLCMPVRKLPAFFANIHPNKVRADLRERIIAFQNECDDALWTYWTQRPKPEPAWPVLLPETPQPDPLADPRVRSAISKKAHDLSLAAFEHNREILERYLRRDWNLTDPDAAIERIHALDLDHGKHMLVDTQQLWHLTSTVAATERCLTVALAAIRTLEDSTGRQLYGRTE